MKKFVSFGLGVGAAALVYLLFAFTMWDANPGNWDSEARALCGYFAACLCIFTTFYVKEAAA